MESCTSLLERSSLSPARERWDLLQEHTHQIHIIQDQARKVARRFLPPHRQYPFIEDAPSEIFLRLGKYDTRYPFAPWCYRVLSNLAISQYRKQRRERFLAECSREIEARPGREEDPGLLLMRREACPPLGPGDLERINRWPARTRILALALSGLWARVPEGQWRQWLTEGGVEPPFPPEGFEEIRTTRAKLGLLSEVLNFSPLTAAQQWHRSRRRLRTLGIVTNCLA